MESRAAMPPRPAAEGLMRKTEFKRKEPAAWRTAAVKNTTVFDNNAEKLRCVLELIDSQAAETTNSGHTGVRATTYFLLPSTLPGEGERAVQRGEPLAFTLPYDDDLYIADFLASFTLQKQQSGYQLRSTDAFFNTPKREDKGEVTGKASPEESECHTRPTTMTAQEAHQAAHFLGEEAKKDIDIKFIARYFRLPISSAARRLQVGETWLKQKCRQHGINRWPYRKLRSIEKFMAKIQQNLEEEAKDEGGNPHRVESLKIQISDLQRAVEKISMGQTLIHDSDDESCHNDATSPDSCERPSKPTASVEVHDRILKRTLSFDETSRVKRVLKPDPDAVTVTISHHQLSPVGSPHDIIQVKKSELKPIIPKIPAGAELEWDSLLRSILTPFAREDSGSPFKWSTPRAADIAELHHNPPSAQSTASNYDVSMDRSSGAFTLTELHEEQSNSKNPMRTSRLLVSPRSGSLILSPRKRFFLGSSPQMPSRLRSDIMSPLKTMHSNSALDSTSGSDVLGMLLCDESLEMRSFNDPESPMPVHLESLLPDLCAW